MTMPRLIANRYRVGPEEYSGGTGIVLICTDEFLERKVAIKYLQPNSNRSRIHDEITALQRIRSNHVVQIYDVVVDESDNKILLVQEYLPGLDAHQLAISLLDDQNYLRLLFQIATGLDDIHREGLIHRDIKPHNMKFDSDGLLKIFDFDLAREDGHDAKTLGFKGTPGFAAPELYTGGTVQFTKAVDVFAFGATALYCATGSLPESFYNRPPSTNAWTVFDGFSTVRPNLGPRITELLDRSLSETVADRPPIMEIQAALAGHLLRGQHRALLTFKGEPYHCDRDHRSVELKANAGMMLLEYDEGRFFVRSVSGDVFINNTAVSDGTQISGSCVITIGGPSLGFGRSFITMDISHPEVVL